MRPITKGALYAGVILVLAGGILFWLGGKTRKYRVETTIQAPPSEVFRHITDPELIPQWAETVVSVEPLTTGKNEAGSRAKITCEKDGEEFVLTDEVKTFEKDSRLVVASVCSMFKLSSDYSLEEAGKLETKFRVEVHLNYRGAYRFIAPFLGNKSTEDQLKADIQQLRTNIESNFDPANYKPQTTDDKAHENSTEKKDNAG